MHRAVSVKPMKNYIILVKFDNGEERVFNCFPLINDSLFFKISDVDFFRTVHVDDMGVVCWDDSTDINPDILYEESEPVSDFSFAIA